MLFEQLTDSCSICGGEVSRLVPWRQHPAVQAWVEAHVAAVGAVTVAKASELWHIACPVHPFAEDALDLKGAWARLGGGARWSLEVRFCLAHEEYNDVALRLHAEAGLADAAFLALGEEERVAAAWQHDSVGDVVRTVVSQRAPIILRTPPALLVSCPITLRDISAARMLAERVAGHFGGAQLEVKGTVP